MTLADTQAALQARTTELDGFTLGRTAFGVFAFNGTTKLTAPYDFRNSANPLAGFLNTALTLKNTSGAEVAYPNFHTGNPRPTDFRSGPSLVAVDVAGESTTIGPAASFSTTFQFDGAPGGPARRGAAECACYGCSRAGLASSRLPRRPWRCAGREICDGGGPGAYRGPGRPGR